jgi:endo-1,3(4)-beta-glucanase
MVSSSVFRRHGEVPSYFGHDLSFLSTFSYRQFDGTSIKQPTQTDWRASFTEHTGAFANHKVTTFDSQALTIQYFNGGSTMNSYLVPGSPYMTFEYRSATPLLTSLNGGITTFNGQNLATGASGKLYYTHTLSIPTSVLAVTASGTQFTVVSTNGITYVIYALSNISLRATATSTSIGSIQATGTYNGVLRIVQLGQASHKALLDQYYQTYPTSVGQDYSFSGTTSTLIFNWNVVGNGANLLMLTWPHHRQVLQNPNYPATTALGYLTTKVSCLSCHANLLY